MTAKKAVSTNVNKYDNYQHYNIDIINIKTSINTIVIIYKTV